MNGQTQRDRMTVDPAKLVVPADCEDAETGRKYWDFVRNPHSVEDARERLRLMSHAAGLCRACTRQVKELAKVLHAAKSA
jgi:hypothetical protein